MNKKSFTYNLKHKVANKLAMCEAHTALWASAISLDKRGDIHLINFLAFCVCNFATFVMGATVPSYFVGLAEQNQRNTVTLT